ALSRRFDRTAWRWRPQPKATMRLMVKRSRIKSRGFTEGRRGIESKSLKTSDVPDSRGFQAFSRRKNRRISRILQGLVNHAGQGVVNHAD
ncbi:MAG: hypothetical protein WAN01_26190, partial [Bradyrhizobium sp.]